MIDLLVHPNDLFNRNPFLRDQQNEDIVELYKNWTLI